MNILLIHPYHPHGMGVRLDNALRRLGHQVTWIGESNVWGHPGYQPNLNLATLLGDEAKQYDLALTTDDNWLPNIMQGWEQLPIPTVLYFGDYQHAPHWFDPLLPLFDHIAILHLDPIARVAQQHPSVHWIPPGVDLQVMLDLNLERTYEVGVVGGINPAYPRRVKRLTEIVARYKTNDVSRYYQRREMAEVYNRSKIVVNLQPDGVKTLNYRIFEGMACGALMITEETDSGLDRLFKRGEHLVVFRDDKEMYRLIDCYLAHDAEREQIAQAGQALVRAQHTWDERMKELLNMVTAAGKTLTAPARHMLDADVRRLYARGYMYRLKIDPMFDLFGEAIPPLWVWPLVARVLLGRIGVRRRWRQRRFQRLGARLTPTQSGIVRLA